MELVIGGVAIPALCYGTAWKEDRTEALTAQALALGFRAIDTANQRKHYVEAGVGAAIAGALGGGIRRDALFVQTKFTYRRGQDDRLPYDPDAPLATQVAQSFARSLEHLGVDHVDSYLLHGPERAEGLTAGDVEVWRAMEALHARGAARWIGVSNIGLDQLEELVRIARVAPAFVQNRCYARTGWDAAIRAACRAHGITYQGFSLLTANRAELAGPVIADVARRAGRTREQVVFRFALQVGMMALTGSASAAHLREDLAVHDFALADADVRAIEALGR